MVRERPLILAVDDYPENLEIVRVRLELQGYDVVTAANGREALERAYDLHPDVILLDIVMPEMDGIAVTKKLKADEAMRAIPLVLFTAKSEIQDIVAGLEAGGDDYLTKPFDQATLVARVRSLMRIKSLYDTVESQKKELSEFNRSLRSASTSRSRNSSGRAACDASCRRNSPTRSCRRVPTPASSNTTGAKSSCCSAICEGLRISPRRRSRKR